MKNNTYYRNCENEVANRVKVCSKCEYKKIFLITVSGEDNHPQNSPQRLFSAGSSHIGILLPIYKKLEHAAAYPSRFMTN